MLGPRSQKMLEGVHPDLARVIKKADALGVMDFCVTEGTRTMQRQAELVAHGASQTLRSRHLTGHAVDLAALINGKTRWDWPLYNKLAVLVKVAANEEKVPLEWGGDWLHFKDGPHFQLPWADYPVPHPASG